MEYIKREQDITPANEKSISITVDNEVIEAIPGESVLSTLLATSKKRVMKNDHEVNSGAYCGMGVCHCCHVEIDGKHKQRACQTIVKANMTVNTNVNRMSEMGINHD